MSDTLINRRTTFVRRIVYPASPELQARSIAEMTEPIAIPERKSNRESVDHNTFPSGTSPSDSGLHPTLSFSDAGSAPGSPLLQSTNSHGLSRNDSFTGSGSFQEDWEAFPPLDRLTVFDLLDNFGVPDRLEKLSNAVTKQTDKVKRQREALKSRGSDVKRRVVDEWKRRVPYTADEKLEKYGRRMRDSMDKLGERWNDTKAVTAREKLSFIAGVANIFISGYLIGGYPEYFHIWYTAQLLYFMPIRYWTYQKRGYHYFLADLCYFVNFLLLLCIWAFPGSKRLFIGTYCLAMGNNAVAIAMWRNSMVFHSLDKVTSLFIHIMPCAALHCMVHLVSESLQQTRFPALHTIRTAPAGDPQHYSLFAMALWSSIPYAIWQLSYHFLITVRRREKIAAGRPTSFTWLRKSYSKSWLGKTVNSLPEGLQEPAFMLIQYSYALATMLPCPIWFWYRIPSGLFLCTLFGLSTYNGATYYLDVFGKRFQNELEAMKKEVAKWQSSPDMMSPFMTPNIGVSNQLGMDEKDMRSDVPKRNSVDLIPMLNAEGATGIDGGARDVATERKIGTSNT